jgi:hypothetical protein
LTGHAKLLFFAQTMPRLTRTRAVYYDRRATEIQRKKLNDQVGQIALQAATKARLMGKKAIFRFCGDDFPRTASPDATRHRKWLESDV